MDCNNKEDASVANGKQPLYKKYDAIDLYIITDGNQFS